MELIDIRGKTLEPEGISNAPTTEGIVFVKNGDFIAIKKLLSAWSTPYRHPHENSPGITMIRASRRDSPLERPGYRGFCRSPLSLHTDRATSSDPPSIIALLVIEPPQVGGETLLADLAPSIEQLARLPKFSDVCRMAVLTSRHGEWPILEILSSGGFRFRYRDDEIANPRLVSEQGLPVLKAIEKIGHSAQVINFQSGEGYIIHNYRYLHGRRAFEGSRYVIRFLARAEIPFTGPWSQRPESDG
jgi:Taurine catabolism dioxygenase TauD, TfdA family